MDDCLSCNVKLGKITTPGGILFENELISVTHSIPPAQCKGFMIVQPKRHVAHIADLTEAEVVAIAKAIRHTANSIKEVLAPEKVYVCSFGETVKHVHFYVIPRTKEMPARGITVLTQILDEGKWRCTEEEAKDVALLIKKSNSFKFLT